MPEPELVTAYDQIVDEDAQVRGIIELQLQDMPQHEERQLQQPDSFVAPNVGAMRPFSAVLHKAARTDLHLVRWQTSCQISDAMHESDDAAGPGPLTNRPPRCDGYGSGARAQLQAWSSRSRPVRVLGVARGNRLSGMA